VTGPTLDAAAATAAHRRPRVARLAAGSLAERYQRGDCRGAWQDLRVADPLDDTWRAEAEQLAALTMQRVRRSAEHLVTALIARGLPVTAEKALAEPAPDIEQRLQLERTPPTRSSAPRASARTPSSRPGTSCASSAAAHGKPGRSPKPSTSSKCATSEDEKGSVSPDGESMETRIRSGGIS
jgi:hypothetical protein